MAESQKSELLLAAPSSLERAIIGQVEYYFSDQNLPNDAYMLGLTGGSLNTPVSVSRISGFSQMRKYKPLSSIKSALQKSTTLEFTDPKHIRRRVPLALPPTVTPAIIDKADPLPQHDLAARPWQNLSDPAKPWLTKRMLQPTGFEPYFADTPLTPAEHAEEASLYDPATTFETRIETALQRYAARRTLHTPPARILDLFLSFGGIDCGPRAFASRPSRTEMDAMDAADIAAALARHFVAAHVVDGSDQWTVDFPGVAAGFLSSDTVLHFGAGPGAAVEFPNVLANFYRYLLHHDVCPEYTTQLRDALRVCATASAELLRALQASLALPDGFGKACSVISGGLFAGLVDDDDESGGWGNAGLGALGLTRAWAEAEMRAAVAQLGSAEEQAVFARADLAAVRITAQRDVALQIVGIEDPAARFGRVSCRRLSRAMDKLCADDAATTVLWIERAALQHCFVGMKLEALLCENTLGCRWVERVKAANASYFRVIANAAYDKEHDTPLPRQWYKRERTIKAFGYRKRGEMEAEGEEKGEKGGEKEGEKEEDGKADERNDE